MIIQIPSTDEADALAKRLRGLADELCDGLKPAEENVLIPNTETLAGPDRIGHAYFYRLTEGFVSAYWGDRLLFYYEQGELVGLDNCLGAGQIRGTLEFAVRADVYAAAPALKKIRKDPKRFELLGEYWAVQSNLFQVLLGATVATVRPNFQMRSFPAGTTIIHQGNTDSEVYSMLSGRADVVVDGRKVGEIGENEIFGEMSRLTGDPRSATVVATTDCETMSFGGEDFNKLATTNPTALMDIARNLSSRLAHLNQSVSEKG